MSRPQGKKALPGSLSRSKAATAGWWAERRGAGRPAGPTPAARRLVCVAAGYCAPGAHEPVHGALRHARRRAVAEEVAPPLPADLVGRVREQPRRHAVALAG